MKKKLIIKTKVFLIFGLLFAISNVCGQNLIIDNTGVNPTPTLLSFNRGVTIPQQIHYKLNNDSVIDIVSTAQGVVPTIVLNFTYNPNEFLVQNTSISAGAGLWTCDEQVLGLIECSTFDLIYSGGQITDFIFEVNPNVITPASTYMNGLAVDSLINGNVSNFLFGTDLDVVNPDISFMKTLEAGTFVHPISGNESAVNGDVVTYKILAINNTPGSSPQNNITFVDALPTGLINPQVTGQLGNFSCSFSGLTLTCNTNNLPHTGAEDGVIFTAQVSGAIGTLVLNSANVTQVQYDSTSNQQIDANLAFGISLPPTNLSVTKVSKNSANNLTSVFDTGETFNYALEIEVTGNEIPPNQIIVTDNLPLEVELASIPTLAGWTCTSSGVSGRLIECINTSVTINSGVPAIIYVPVIAGPVAANFDNTAFVGLNPVVAPLVEIVGGANSSTHNVTLNAPNGTVAITKTASQPNYIVGDMINYTIEVENTNAAASFFDIEITDILPVAYLDGTSVSFSVTPIVGSTVFTCSYDAIDTVSCTNNSSPGLNDFLPGDRVEINISAIADDVGVNVPNIASARSLQSGPLGDSQAALINITQSAPPSVDQTAINVVKRVLQNGVQVSEVAKGTSFEYEVTVSNIGNNVVTNLSVVDTMPSGVVVDNIVVPIGVSCNNQGQTYNCNASQNIPLGASLDIIYEVTDVSEVSITSLINNVTAVPGNAQPQSAQATVTLTGINPSPNSQYTIEVIDDVDPVQQGVDYNYTIKITNTGEDVLDTIDVDFQAPSELTINSFNADGVNCSNITTGLSCSALNGLSIAPNQSRDVVVINVISSDFFGNTIVEASASQNGLNVVTDAETTTVLQAIVIPQTDLAISIINTQEAIQGRETSFDVKIENLSAQQAIDPIANIELSGLIETITVDSNSDWNCGVEGTNVNCQFEDDSILNGPSSLIHITTGLSRVSAQAENLFISATVSSDTEDEFLANNTANATISVDPTPSEGEILDALSTALDGIGNEQTKKAIENVASYCETYYFTALEGLCSSLYQNALDGNGEAINDVMEQITPNEVIGQSTSISEIATAQFRNVGSRLSQLRSGGGSGFSLAGLNASFGNGSIPLGMLAYLNKVEDDKKTSDIDVNNDFISPWGFFVNGTISMGSRDATGRELGFDFNSYGLTAGVDYRLSANKVVGLAVGYANFDSEVDSQAELDSTGVTLTGYGSFYINDNFYVDTRISAAKPDFSQVRNINFTLGDITVSRVAKGNTSGDQYTVSMSAGYNFYKNSWNITPNASFRYINTNINGFTETGAGDFNFNYSNQELESLLWSAGIKLSKAISLNNGVITPQFDFDYNYESLNDGNDIEARFINAPSGEIFIIETDSPDRTYGSAGLGFVYISSNGKQAYINYRSVLGLEGFSRGTFNLGARFEF